MPEDIVQGWTENMDFQLFAAGLPLDLTGMAVTTVGHDKNGVAVTLGGVTTVEDIATGKVRYAPTGTEFTKALSPYAVRFKVTASSKAAFFPNGVADIWTVRL